MSSLLALVELSVIVIVFGFTLLRPSNTAAFSRLAAYFRALARRRTLSIVSVGLFVLVARVSLIPLLGIPQPRWHDEYSYLLAADTFAHGLITNPPHPMWIHFETFHVIQHPTYMSMYPPLQGIVLAIGQRLGHPWIGQLLVSAAMCSAICWMLQGWLPLDWALFGATLAALRLAIMSYWMNTYWAASVVALAGALLIGAWPRCRRRRSSASALVMGLALVMLANSRPFEGLLLALALVIALAIQGTKGFRAAILPLLVVCFLGALASGYFYHRVTGSAFVMTYQVNRSAYSRAPYFIWQAPRSPLTYHNEEMQRFYDREFADFIQARTLPGFLRRAADKIARLWAFYLGPLLTLPLLALPWLVRDRRLRFAFFALALLLAGSVFEVWTSPHYLAAGTGLLYLVLTQALRRLQMLKTGTAMARSVMIVACVMLMIRLAAIAFHAPLDPPWPRGDLQRAAILAQLQRAPGQQLVIVHYAPSHDLDREWVYNPGDLNGSKVLWARDLGETSNRELIDYYAKRTVWMAYPDSGSVTLQPYPAR